MVNQVSNCQACRRPFLPNKCQEHCSGRCCRAKDCVNATRDGHAPRSTVLQCIVCHTPAKDFQRFAPCTTSCKTRVYFQSSKGEFSLGAGIYRRRYVFRCHLFEPEDLPEDWHQPDRPARIHQKYCSLRCYNSVAFGHETRRLEGQRLRTRRKESRSGGQAAAPGWRNRWRQEQGYFREAYARKMIRQGNILRYGDERSDAEIRSLDVARRAAEQDADFQEIFGSRPPLPNT